jgi:DNA polymerase-3 subunit epsilon
VWAEQSPFDLKDTLRSRRYRWSDGSDGRPRSCYIHVSKPSLDAEVSVLRTEMIYLSDIEPRLQTLTAISRFSSR